MLRIVLQDIARLFKLGIIVTGISHILYEVHHSMAWHGIKLKIINKAIQILVRMVSDLLKLPIRSDVVSCNGKSLNSFIVLHPCLCDERAYMKQF